MYSTDQYFDGCNRDVKPANIISSYVGTNSMSTSDSKDTQAEMDDVNVKDRNIMKISKSNTDTLKLIDFGTAIGVADSKNSTGCDASESLMTFNELEFAG